VPLDNEVSNWTVDKSNPKTANQRAMVGTTKDEVELWVDGGATAFFMAPYTPKLFLWQNYVNTSLPIAPDGANVSLFVLQLPSAEQANGLYSALLTVSDYTRKKDTPDDWKPTTPVLGAESRIQDTATQWWVNFHQNEFYVEVFLDPSAGPAPDFTPGNEVLKNEAIRFAKAIADRISK
jgi:hypothetical protein